MASKIRLLDQPTTSSFSSSLIATTSAASLKIPSNLIYSNILPYLNFQDQMAVRETGSLFARILLPLHQPLVYTSPAFATFKRYPFCVTNTNVSRIAQRFKIHHLALADFNATSDLQISHFYSHPIHSLAISDSSIDLAHTHFYSFPSLKNLSLSDRNCSSLFTIDNRSLPNLRFCKIEGYRNIRFNHTSLESLSIDRCSVTQRGHTTSTDFILPSLTKLIIEYRPEDPLEQRNYQTFFNCCSTTSELSIFYINDLEVQECVEKFPPSFRNLSRLTTLKLYSRHYSGALSTLSQFLNATPTSLKNLLLNNFTFSSAPTAGLPHVSSLASLHLQDCSIDNNDSTLICSLFPAITSCTISSKNQDATLPLLFYPTSLTYLSTNQICSDAFFDSLGALAPALVELSFLAGLHEENVKITLCNAPPTLRTLSITCNQEQQTNLVEGDINVVSENAPHWTLSISKILPLNLKIIRVYDPRLAERRTAQDIDP